MQPTARLILRSPEETAALARWLAPRLRPGDVLLLDGPIGAGKTHFARALIQALLATPEDVPSPTFTLVQSYESADGNAIWHADLYRLTDPEEVIELGLDEAFETAICLVEWPDRLGALAPAGALRIGFAAGPDDDARELSFAGEGPWQDLIATLQLWPEPVSEAADA
ncbi:tRNA (adenosine(37)-N6)-threonylcarbamoyltransferase complex ATPase subunit type 1 TsaE [Acidimangrovimonas pyrenivorans]|uniref:tRNA threonylcarbamoyladenosine biosynthesis protein TsaE n=1 Tax=Acidimangrovimonas pyrenivorans TaxID=2030798 RepID=A0ABV7AL73_9RHOB